MNRHAAMLSLLLLGAATAGGAQPATAAPLSATAALRDPAGQVLGTASFTPQGAQTRVTVEVRGLTPGEHGMHVHELGSCTPGEDPATGQVVAFGGAGPHFDPARSHNHDSPTAMNKVGHGGDLPRLPVGADGVGRLTFTTDKISLSGMDGVLDRSIVIHAQPDDYKSDPAGMSGARERCGVIARTGLQVRHYPLPGPQDFPEGIAYDASRDLLLTGSARNGNIYAVNATTGAVSLFSPGGAKGRQVALGLKLDRQGRLWVAGGATGMVSVLSRDGAPVATIETPPSPQAYLNDLTVAPDGNVYVTDSFRPMLWRIGADMKARPWLDLGRTPIKYGPGINLNGVTHTPDGRYLLTIQLNTGDLWRIDTRTQAVQKVMGGLTRGDGLLLDGLNLYVTRNAEQVVSKVRLSSDYGSGQLVTQEPLTGLRFPTTLAAVGTQVVVVEGQLDKLQGGTPQVPFRLTRFNKF